MNFCKAVFERYFLIILKELFICAVLKRNAFAVANVRLPPVPTIIDLE